LLNRSTETGPDWSASPAEPTGASDSIDAIDAGDSGDSTDSGDWMRLERLVAKLSTTGRARDPGELREFWRRYRAATSRLAHLQAESAASDEAFYLNRLVGAAHGILYRPRSRTSGWRRLVRFVAGGWPTLVRANAAWVLLAAGLFALGAAVGGFYAWRVPGFLGMVASPEILHSIDRGEMWTQGLLSIRPAASSFIFSNNLTVAIVAFALGITAGLGTVWVLFLNGVSFGALAVAVVEAEMAADFWGFVAMHGVLELPAIFIAGAAGLILGWGMLAPGDRPRRRSIRAAAGVSVRLLAGCVPVLLVAAAVEAYASPGSLELSTKLGLAGVTGAGFLAYLTRSPSKRRPQRRFSARTRR
jgi:uncharacterized membrane protein SpoIIM required for sporulation